MLKLLILFPSLVGCFYFVRSEEIGNGNQDRFSTRNEKLIFPTSDDDIHHHNHYYHNHEGYSPQFFPHNFQHSPEFHQKHFGGRGGGERKIKFENDQSKKVESKPTLLNEIPISFMEKFDNIEVNDLLANYVDGYNAEAPTIFESRFGNDEQERNAGMIPPKAGCVPENTSVALASSNDSTVVYIPKCTRIERCGGCCSHRLLSCQPIETETLSIQVVKTQYVGGKKLKYIGKEIIPLERHLKCKCSCKIKAEHCSILQEYRPDQCGCTCRNTDKEAKCIKELDFKYWDNKSCLCKCRSVIECSTGSVYDHNECRCKIIPKRRYARIEKTHVTTLYPDNL